jgi:methyl-accepting chemotaxis protein
MRMFSFSAIRSVQLKIALIAGLCLTVTGIILIGCSIYSAQATHQFVTTEVTKLVDAQTKESLLNRAYGEAQTIRTELDVAFDTARSMAQSFAVLADDKNNGTPVESRRAQLNSVLRNVLQLNPKFNGTYSAWEPDALDGKDVAFKGQKQVGSDNTGRFLPYWTRSANGAIAVQPLVEYDSSALHPNGLIKGGWYITPLATGKESVLGPLPYIVQGQSVFLATMSVPIVVDGRVLGVAGADYDLAFVQKLAVKINASLFDGKGQVAILSDSGLIVANSANPGVIGKTASEANPRWSESVAVVRRGVGTVLDEPNQANLDIYSPIKLGLTDTNRLKS